ncbi:hypothetical protein D3C81_1975790 [compost metagenome]
MPTGSFCVAIHIPTMLATRATTTPSEISGRCTPTYLMPEAHMTSNRPATTSTNHGFRDISQDMAAA